MDSEKLQDFVSRDLFRSIGDSEEEHVDVIETHLNLVDKVGKLAKARFNKVIFINETVY